MQTADVKKEELEAWLSSRSAFTITYFAKKYGKMISRMGYWNDKCRMFWSSRDVQAPLCITYFDVERNDYRTATDIRNISGIE